MLLDQMDDKLVIRTVFLCNMRWTWSQMADRPRLEAILLGLAV
jgi:hypothetical protein